MSNPYIDEVLPEEQGGRGIEGKLNVFQGSMCFYGSGHNIREKTKVVIQWWVKYVGENGDLFEQVSWK